MCIETRLEPTLRRVGITTSCERRARSIIQPMIPNGLSVGYVNVPLYMRYVMSRFLHLALCQDSQVIVHCGELYFTSLKGLRSWFLAGRWIATCRESSFFSRFLSDILSDADCANDILIRRPMRLANLRHGPMMCKVCISAIDFMYNVTRIQGAVLTMLNHNMHPSP